MERTTALKRIRLVLAFFTIALVISGLTAIPVKWELSLIEKWFNSPGGLLPTALPELSTWLAMVTAGVNDAYTQYPFLPYGNDWLAFGHLIIGLSFFGAIKDPVRNRWVLEYGMIACVLVIPWAFIFGAIREIPTYWGFIDSAFGIFGIIPLAYARKLALNLEKEAG